MADLALRIAGEAGQGVLTTGSLLVGALHRLGVHLLATQGYMSRIRGGLNWYDIRLSGHAVLAPRADADLLVSFTDEARDLLATELAPGGLRLHDGEAFSDGIALPCSTLATKLTGSTLYANSVAAGAIFSLLGYPVEPLCAHLHELFGKNEVAQVEPNQKCAQAGHEAMGQAGHAGRLPGPPATGKPFGEIWSGAAALGLGAATAGVKLVAAYPMSPSTATFTWLAGAAEQYGMVVEQAEDEIAAINMVCGATYAGVAALTTTSGGGFALMTEGVSLAGIMELPAVIVIAQRPGPGTGLPTRTAQQDLQFALRAGHGEFARAIFAPGDVGQCYHLMRQALAVAHRWQTPVILLTDQFLQDMQADVEGLVAAENPIDRCLVTTTDAAYERYSLAAPDGVSPRAVPGGPARVVMDSDEHTCAGHLTEDLRMRLAQDGKRLSKVAGMPKDALPPDWYGPKDAATLLVCWGSTGGACREAAQRCCAAGKPTAVLHATQVWPLAEDLFRQAFAGRRVVCVEANQTGQFAALLQERGLLTSVAETVGRADGLPFSATDILERIG